MTTFATMRSRIADELHRTDLTTSINRAIETAIQHWGQQRFYFNEAFAKFTATAGQQTYSAGVASLTDVIAIKSARLVVSTTRQPLTPWTWRQFIEENVSTTQQGVPDYYVWQAQSVLLYPTPNATYSAELTVIARLPEVSLSASDGATNAWMTDGEALIRQRAKAIVRCDYIQDPRAIQEAAALAGTMCMSVLEKGALDSLMSRSEGASTGRLVPTKF